MLVCCLPLSLETIDHAPLSRRSTVPTPDRDTSTTLGRSLLVLSTPSIYIFKKMRRTLPPSYSPFVATLLSPRIAIVVSPSRGALNFIRVTRFPPTITMMISKQRRNGLSEHTAFPMTEPINPFRGNALQHFS